MAKMAVAELQAGLDQFSGSLTMTRHWTGRLYFTEGVKFLAENAGGGAYWLIDLIASYIPKCQKDEMLRDFQVWRLVKHDPPLVRQGVVDGEAGPHKYMATAYCDRDTDDTAFHQHIPCTDFPLPEVKLYCELGSVDGVNPAYVLMLPNER
jgi:hypothetical protein